MLFSPFRAQLICGFRLVKAASKANPNACLAFVGPPFEPFGISAAVDEAWALGQLSKTLSPRSSDTKITESLNWVFRFLSNRSRKSHNFHLTRETET